MKRKMPIGRLSDCKMISMDGRRFFVKKPTGRPSEFMLKNRGVIVHLDFFEHHEWLERLTEKYSQEKSLQHHINVPLSALKIDLGEGNCIIAEIIQEGDWSKDVYLVNCYSKLSRECEMQVMCDISGSKAKFIRVEETSGGQKNKNNVQEDTTAAIIAVLMLGVKVYLNITRFAVIDEMTETTGPYETTIKPVSIFGYKDYLMMEK